MSNLIDTRKEYGQPIGVAVATMLGLFIVVVLLGSLTDMSPIVARRLFTFAWLVGSVVGVGTYAAQSNQGRNAR